MRIPRTIHHRFIPGLRFEEHWRYRARSPSGMGRWTPLPMQAEARALPDPFGAWWCTRRCAAVLLQRPWLCVVLPYQLPPQPDACELAQILEVLLPGWAPQVQTRPEKWVESVGAQTFQRCTQAVEQGGGALMLLEHAELNAAGVGPRPRAFWAWIMGMELPPRARYASPSPSRLSPEPLPTSAPQGPHSLLALPSDAHTPWSSHYATRIQMQPGGLCDLSSTDGPWRTCRWLATITLHRDGMPEAGVPQHLGRSWLDVVTAAHRDAV